MDMVFSTKDFAYITINFYEFLSWNTENVYYLSSWKRGRGDNRKSSQECFVGRTVLLHTFYSSRSDSNPVAWDGPPNVGIDTSICSDYMQWDFFSSNKICSLPHQAPTCLWPSLVQLCLCNQCYSNTKNLQFFLLNYWPKSANIALYRIWLDIFRR